MVLKDFGYYLRVFRERENMNQLRLSEKLGIAPETLSRLENGHNMPSKKTFRRILMVFAYFGLTYDEVQLDLAPEYTNAERKLVEAIEHNAVEELEPLLDNYRKYLDPQDIEQLYLSDLAHFLYMKNNGLDSRGFIDKCKKLFEKNNVFPTIDEIRVVRYTKTEFMLLYKIAMTYVEVGEIEKAEDMLEALLINGFSTKKDYFVSRSRVIAIKLVELLVKNKQMARAKRCIDFVCDFEIEGGNMNLITSAIELKAKICHFYGDTKGEKTCKEYLGAYKKLRRYLSSCSRHR